MSLLVVTEEVADKVDAFFESKKAHGYIILLVLINALVTGLDAIPSIKIEYGSLLAFVDKMILSIFILEMSARIIVTRERFFKNYWNVLDLGVILISVIPAFNLSSLRVLRALHSLRLLELFPKTRHIIDSVAHSMTGILNVLMLAFIFYYIFAVMATNLFGTISPELFGSLGISMLRLFRFMTSGGWDMFDEIFKVKPNVGWAFFITFIVFISYFILNLVIGVVVGAMSKAEEENEVKKSQGPSLMEKSVMDLAQEMIELRQEVMQLRAQLTVKQSKKEK